MKKIIHNLRQKSEQDRRHFLHLIVSVLAILLIIAWILSLGVNISKKETKEKIKEDLKPFTVLKNSILDNNPFSGNRN